MIKRYEHTAIAAIWTNEAKLKRWDQVELAVIRGRVDMQVVPYGKLAVIKNVLETNPADIEWWLNRDKEVGHDLNAYLDERRRHIPTEL